jgi:PAS domain-containing protein
MRKLFQRQLAKATKEPGKVDLELLADLVTAAYEEANRDRKRTDRSILLMADELQRTHARLLEAFKVVPEGLVLLNAEGRYVLFNKKFLELYDTAVDRIAVGGSFADSVRAGVERGHYLMRSGERRNGSPSGSTSKSRIAIRPSNICGVTAGSELMSAAPPTAAASVFASISPTRGGARKS